MALLFSEENIKRRLDCTSPIRRAAFAAACSERLFPGYIVFNDKSGRGNWVVLREILDDIWSSIENSSIDVSVIDKQTDTVESLSPDENDGEWILEQASAEDTVAAIAYTLDCLKSGASQEAAWAARRAYEAIDNYIINISNTNASILDVDETAVISNELIQSELYRQQVDIDDLLTDSEVIHSLRIRAKRDSSIFLPWYCEAANIINANRRGI
ncbi:MAG: DUF416 family protein [Roseiarcus sp.]